MSFKNKRTTSEENQTFNNAGLMGLTSTSHKETLGLVSLEPRILLGI